mmetsp:Transcript_35761/g.107579  ORF Transcript_35761/g.107579 Transcript_35761/m.107579 type:complete len:229 (+) Transcript_35761:442-1128(+)
MKPRVGVWQGPYDSVRASKPSYLPWKCRVVNRVNATPTRKSSSCLASTASANRSSGSPSVRIALSMSSGVTAENLARLTIAPGRSAGRHTSNTWNAMASPSRSQSKKSTSASQPAAVSLRFLSTAPFVGTETTGASHNSAGSQPSQSRYAGAKSNAKQWPSTDVTRNSTALPPKRPRNSCVRGVPRRVLTSDLANALAMASAIDGFSATHMMQSMMGSAGMRPISRQV